MQINISDRSIRYFLSTTLILYFLIPFKIPVLPASLHVFTLLITFALVLASKKINTHRDDILFYVFSIFILSTSLAFHDAPKMNALFAWSTSLVMFWTLRHSGVKFENKLISVFTDIILGVWATFSIAQALLGSSAYFAGWFGVPRPSLYSSGLTLYSNYAAVVMVPMLIALFVQILNQKRAYKLCLWFFGIMALYFMMSRAAWLGLLISMITIVFSYRSEPTKIAISAQLIGIMIIAVGISTLLPSKLDYIETSHLVKQMDEDISAQMSKNPVDYSANTRIVTVGVAIKAMTEFPLKGLGLGHFPEYYQKNYAHFSEGLEIDPRKLMTPHNGYIQLMSENGFITFAVLMGFIFLVLKHSYRSTDPHTITLFASVISVLIWLLFHDGLGERILWILLGLLSSTYNSKKV